jgi:hypothetical protein
MRKGEKAARPRWPVAWGCNGNGVGRVPPHGKIARLPRGIREELNRRLQQGERGAPLASWLNGLPETKAALARDLGGPKVTLRHLAEWERGAFRDWQAKQDTESNIVRQFQAWVRQPQTREKIFGPPMTEFMMRNHIRRTFGRELIAREDIPPGENWDIPLINPNERIKCFWRIIGLPPPGEDEEEPSTAGVEGSATAPPPTQSEGKSN